MQSLVSTNERTFPLQGWEYITIIDLSPKCGHCASCGTAIRYVHHISHAEYGAIGVGCECADRLTGSQAASENEGKAKKLVKRKERYMNSPKWESHKNGMFFKLDGYCIRIWCHDTYFNLEIGFMVRKESNGFIHYEFLKSKRRYYSAWDAKEKAFDVITSGRLLKYVESRK